MSTRAPSRAKARATARPIPLEAPVTTTPWPANRPCALVVGLDSPRGGSSLMIGRSALGLVIRHRRGQRRSTGRRPDYDSAVPEEDSMAEERRVRLLVSVV